MTVLGTVLRKSRPDERNYAWNLRNLSGPGTLTIESREFADGSTLAPKHAGKRVGGDNVSPHLTWSEVPAGTTELMLLVEDTDAPLVANPAVHCLAVIDPDSLQVSNELPPGALARSHPAQGVTLLRSVVSRGYFGPEPLKGHGPHRYVFQVYTLGERLSDAADVGTLIQSRPRRVLAAVQAPILARGRIVGVYER